MRKSESVWFEQVDTALIEKIKNIVKLPDGKGGEKSVPVFVRKPDEDFKIESYPSIYIYNLYARRDTFRYNQEKQIVSRDKDSGVVTIENSAIPFSLFYQIDFFSRLQAHQNAMTRMWLGNLPDKNFTLEVRDMSDIPRKCNVIEVEGMNKRDYFEREQRTFHSYITYRVWVELDEKIQYEEQIIKEIDNLINIKK